ncbi:MAG TPA: MBL fold metallo-hydrolase [Spirochaetota bacterium]|nr:MBL fold metallo-hydrolase [Spirochaetota bacterium]
MADLKVTVLCDDINGREKGWQPDPGFAALIQTQKQLVLFDTGMYPEHLSNNLQQTGIKAADINAVILSHNHNDHTNGLEAVLQENTSVPVYIHSRWEKKIPFIGKTIPAANTKTVSRFGTQPGLPDNILITPPLPSPDYGGIYEQGIYIGCAHNMIMICGCCHPGLTAFLQQQSQLGITENLPLTIIGGMHGFRFSQAEAASLTAHLKTVILAHCTQHVALFRKQFQDKCSLNRLGQDYHFT